MPIARSPLPHRCAATPARGRLRRLAAALVVAAGLAVLPALPAQAHDSLGSSSPASGATVGTAPHAVALTFEEAVLDSADATVLLVRGPDGASRHFETGCPKIAGRTVTAPVSLGAAGRYAVTWRAVSDDGHPVSGTFSFTLSAAGASSSAGSASGPACGAGSAAASSEGSSAATSVSPGVLALLGVGGALVLLLIVVLVVVALRLSRRSATAAAGQQQG